MKVLVSGMVYDSENSLVGIKLSDTEKGLIANMAPNANKFVTAPESTSDEAIELAMDRLDQGCDDPAAGSTMEDIAGLNAEIERLKSELAKADEDADRLAKQLEDMIYRGRIWPRIALDKHWARRPPAEKEKNDYYPEPRLASDPDDLPADFQLDDDTTGSTL